MAKVTEILVISNLSSFPLVVKNGENPSQTVTIEAGSKDAALNMWVPWIGNPTENWKAILLVGGAEGDVNLWVYQDYWQPPGADAVKYSDTPDVYNNGQEIFGNNRGGGRKRLVFNVESYGPELQIRQA